MKRSLKEAQDFVDKAKKGVDRSARPLFHAGPSCGWCNDPNGFVCVDGECHLFFQYNPYDTQWGPMHWGHLKSRDFLHWEELPIALAPEEPYESGGGCFSGTSLYEKGRLILMYTAVDAEGHQEQCLAYSEDLLHFEKDPSNPVLTHDRLPHGADPAHFRDPKLFARSGDYYCLCCGVYQGKGNLYLFRSHHLKNWEFVGVLFDAENKDAATYFSNEGPLECPDIQSLGGKDLLLFSPVGKKREGGRYQNLDSSLAMVGRLDLRTGAFAIEAAQELDAGYDFYAPEMCRDERGEILMVAWLGMWGRKVPCAGKGFANGFTLPRAIVYEQGKIKTKIPSWLSASFDVQETKGISLANGQTASLPLRDNEGLIHLAFDLKDSRGFSLSLLDQEGKAIALSYDKTSGLLRMDRSAFASSFGGDPSEPAGRIVEAGVRDSLSLTLALDEISLEVFAGEGDASMSAQLEGKTPIERAQIEGKGPRTKAIWTASNFRC